jgi:hypothetical protein
MRLDLLDAWESAKKSDLYNRHPSVEDIEPVLSPDEKVIQVLKCGVASGRLENWNDIKVESGGGLGTAVLTDRRLYIFARGMIKSLTNRQEAIEFHMITGAEARKNLSFGQMIHVSRQDNTDTLTNLKKEEAQKFIEQLRQKMEESRSGTSDRGEAVSDPIVAIEKLKTLLDMGAITQEEFDAKKKDLLDSI